MSTPNDSQNRPATQRPTRRQAVVQTAALVAAPALATTAPILLQFSHVVTADTPKGKAAQRFKELAEARTGGRVRVEIFPDSRLYKDREEIDALRRGAVQMLAPSLSKLAGLGGGAMEVFDLPFLFRDEAAFRTVAQGPVGASLLQRMERSGILGLAYWENGFKVFTANRPLAEPQDIRGLRVRVQSSRVLVEQMKALGVRASISPLIDVRAALEAGELDGQENTPSNIVTQRLHEVQSHLVLTNHGYLGYAVIVNQRFWLGLPMALREALGSALRDATAYANRIAADENLASLRRITASGRITLHTPTPAQLTRWRDAMAPTWRATSEWIGTDTLAEVRRAVGLPP